MAWHGDRHAALTHHPSVAIQQQEMKIECVPIVWPIGDGPDFKGVLHRESREVHLYEKQGRTEKAAEVTMSLDDPALADAVSEELYKQLLDDVELLDGLMPPLDKAAVLAGKQTPLFFGSGINNFGVQLFLDRYGKGRTEAYACVGTPIDWNRWMGHAHRDRPTDTFPSCLPPNSLAASWVSRSGPCRGRARRG